MTSSPISAVGPGQSPAAQPAGHAGQVFVYAALVALLIGALFGVLVFSRRAEREAEVANAAYVAASQQATRYQTILTALLEIERDLTQRASPFNSVDKMRGASSVFQRTLLDLGPTQDGQADTIPLVDEELFRLVGETRKAWAPLYTQIQRIDEAGDTQDPAVVKSAVDAAQRNVALGELLPKLAERVRLVGREPVERSTLLRDVCLGATGVALLLVPSFYFFDRLRRDRRVAEEASLMLTRSNATLERQRAELAQSKRETDLIMETAQEGLMLIDRNYTIGGQYSKELRTIFRLEELAGLNLVNILQRVLTEKMFHTSRDYLGLLFDAKRKEKQVLRVNPLDEIEIHFPDGKGGFVSRHLGFTFRRITEGEEVRRVFVAVRDITARVELERKLRDAEKKKQRQMDLLLAVVHGEAGEIEEFLGVLERETAAVNEALKAEDLSAGGLKHPQLLDRLNRVFRSVHTIKGHAALVKFEYFQKVAEEFESKIAELRGRTGLTGDDFLPIVVCQAGLRGDLQELHELRQRIVAARPTGRTRPPLPTGRTNPPVPTGRTTPPVVASAPVAPPAVPAGGSPLPAANGNGETRPPLAAGSTVPPVAASAPAPAEPGPEVEDAVEEPAEVYFQARGDWLDGLRELTASSAAEMGKEAIFEAAPEVLEPFGPNRRALLRDVLIQLIRNSVAHSVEPALERIRKGKPRAGRLTLLALPPSSAGHPGFAFRDDGNGLDLAKIRRRAVESGLIGLDDAAAASDDDLVPLIFEPGFSTAEASGPVAGRGMGMDIIRNRIVDDAGGEIGVASEPGQFCEFSFHLPPEPAAARA